MAIVEPGKGRAIIEQIGARLRVTVPAAKHIVAIPILAVWAIIWAVGEISLVRTLLQGFGQGPSAEWFAYMMICLAWTLIGAWLVGKGLWAIGGREIIELNSTTLTHRRQVPIFSRKRDFSIAKIANLRLNLVVPSWNDGMIAFDYGGDTRYLASELEEADAKYVISQMLSHVKALHVVRAPDSDITAGVAPADSRLTVEDDGGNLRITTRVAGHPLLTFVFAAFLVFSIHGEISAIIALVNGAPLEDQRFTLFGVTDEGLEGRDFTLFMLSWLMFGPVIIVVFAGLFLWNIAGREIIELDSTTLRRIRRIPIYSQTREYAVASISDLHLAYDLLPNEGRKGSLLNLMGGAIVFDYGRSSHYLGSDLDEAEARYVISEMCKRVNPLCAPKDWDLG